jgi:hypothetical protein
MDSDSAIPVDPDAALGAEKRVVRTEEEASCVLLPTRQGDVLTVHGNASDRPEQIPGPAVDDAYLPLPASDSPQRAAVPHPPAPEEGCRIDTDPLLDCRQEWFTEFGGLLFLAPQMKRLGIIDTIQTDPLFKERPLRWALHCLSLELVPADAHDPGVLAFCGLQPDKPPPGKDEPAMGRAEARRFEQWRERLVAVLCDDLGWRQMSDAHLLQRLCGRKARIVAEPGWIEVFLALADVCLDIRKAGLDLDPGFIPWLGVVIKFHYA